MSPALNTLLFEPHLENGGAGLANGKSSKGDALNSHPISAEANGNGVHTNGSAICIPSMAHTLLGAPYEPPLSPEDPDWPLHVPTVNMDAKDKGTADAWWVVCVCLHQ